MKESDKMLANKMQKIINFYRKVLPELGGEIEVNISYAPNSISGDNATVSVVVSGNNNKTYAGFTEINWGSPLVLTKESGSSVDSAVDTILEWIQDATK